MTRATNAARLVIVAALLQVGADESGCGGPGPVLRDPGFDLWCGDRLCAWKVVRGDVKRVGTWHEGDSGVEFIGEDAAIQQTTPVGDADGRCILFSLVANVETDADVFLDIDLQADGVVERSERIPTSNWKPLEFHIFIKPPYDGIRFELHKRGRGEAVLAQIGAKFVFDCTGLPEIDPGPRPIGSSCNGDGDCASGLCRTSPTLGATCVGCDLGEPLCGAGESCGLGDPLSMVLAVPIACVPTGADELAEQCIDDAECASGICNGLVCSACATSADCGGATCGASWTTNQIGVGPDVCRPGEQAGVPGTACGTDADCASNSCSGSDRKECSDRRPCTDTAQCPPDDGTLTPGACNTVGIQGGRCD